jgi:hypothetical protein
MRKHTRHEAHTPSARNASLTPGFSKARFASSRLFRNAPGAHDAAGERDRGIQRIFFLFLLACGESSNISDRAYCKEGRSLRRFFQVYLAGRTVTSRAFDRHHVAGPYLCVRVRVCVRVCVCVCVCVCVRC